MGTTSTARWLPFCLWGCIFLLLLVGCGREAGKTNVLRVAGAVDLLPLAYGLKPAYDQLGGQPVQVITTTASIKALKAGQVDVALLGKEPDPAELQGLEDHVVAYDAVSVLIDARSYMGGVQIDLQRMPREFKSKTDGLRNLSFADLRKYFGNPFRPAAEIWLWQNGFSKYQGDKDAVDGRPKEDPKNPGYTQGNWLPTAVYLHGDILPPGKFDTQGALFQTLGLQEADLLKTTAVFLPSYLDSEEELISFKFRVDPTMTQRLAPRQFDFMVAIASRRIALRAIKHGFAVRALSVDGVDPLGDPQVIYDGTYAFSRKIHVLVRQPTSHAARELVDLLLSGEGQKLVEQTGFLSLPASH
jgi:hypothetical protein